MFVMSDEDGAFAFLLRRSREAEALAVGARIRKKHGEHYRMWLALRGMEDTDDALARYSESVLGDGWEVEVRPVKVGRREAMEALALIAASHAFGKDGMVAEGRDRRGRLVSVMEAQSE